MRGTSSYTGKAKFATTDNKISFLEFHVLARYKKIPCELRLPSFLRLICADERTFNITVAKQRRLSFFQRLLLIFWYTDDNVFCRSHMYLTCLLFDSWQCFLHAANIQNTHTNLKKRTALEMTSDQNTNKKKHWRVFTPFNYSFGKLNTSQLKKEPFYFFACFLAIFEPVYHLYYVSIHLALLWSTCF